jgi:hypothetical protein
MSYMQGLKTLREKMFQAPKKSVEDERTSFVPVRVEQNEGPASEELIDRAAKWLSDIRQASSEIKQKMAPLQNSGGFSKGFNKSVQMSNETKEAVERKEAFIKRRDEDSPSRYAPQRPSEKGVAAIPVDADTKKVLDALAAVESRGSGDYLAKGPVVTKGAYKGQRAYGRYQVMEGNIGPWTKEVLGREMTKEEFLKDESAQDQVAAYKLTKAKDKYGTWEDAASVWFSGRPISKAGKASDGYTTVPEYINKFRKNYVR